MAQILGTSFRNLHGEQPFEQFGMVIWAKQQNSWPRFPTLYQMTCGQHYMLSIQGLPNRYSRNVAGEDFTVEEVWDCLRSFPVGSSGGFSGLMASHLPGPK